MTAYTTLRERLSREPSTWLITGAAGFIGSHICQTLLEHDQRVVGYDDLSTGYRRNVDDVRGRVGAQRAERFEFVEADIRDAAALERAAGGARYLVHQAAIASVPRSIENPGLSHSANVDGFFTVLEVARSVGVESVVYASSSSVYGDHPKLPKREDEVGQVLSPYAATKRCNETYAEAWAQAYGMKVRGLRYFNVFGPRQDPEGAYAAVIPRWIATMAAGEQPTIFGDGETSRDFCPVANAVQANLLAATVPESAGMERVFNVALGGRTTLNELFVALRDSLARAGAPCGGLEVIHEDFRPGDIRHSNADISRAQERLGYAPEVSCEAGLSTTVEWFLRE